MDRLVAVYDVFDIVTAPNPPLYVMPASQAYRTWRPDVPFPSFIAAHLAVGPPPPPVLNGNNRFSNYSHSTKMGGGGYKENGFSRNYTNSNSHRRRRDNKSSATSDTASSGKLSSRVNQEENRKKGEKSLEVRAPAQVERYPADPSGGASVVITKTKGRVMCRLEYSREFMMQCAMSPWTKLSPPQMPYIVQNFPELLPPGPQAFSPAEYKVKYAKLKQSS